MRSHKYEEGRRKALEALGLTQRPDDNPLISGFLAGIDGDAPAKKENTRVSRLDRPTSWGPKFTIPAEDVGVGV